MKKSETFHTPFSPSIMETEVPKRFLDIVNEIGDEVAEALAASLVKNTTLTMLTVEGIRCWRSVRSA